MNKKGFEFSFGWLFSVLVGAAVLFLAVYVSFQLMNSETIITESSNSKDLGILLNPIGTGLEDGKKTIIDFPKEVTLEIRCDSSENAGFYGYSSIKAVEKGNKNSESVENKVYDKYIFGEKNLSGKSFYVLSKSFKMPYKVADIIFFVDGKKDYCLINPPNEIEDEFGLMGLKFVNISSSIKDCKKESVKVCFSSIGCDIDINIQSKSIRKDGKVMYYENSLLYGAIFSDYQTYECNVVRLMKRTSELANLYASKIRLISHRTNGCGSSLEPNLILYSQESVITGSREIIGLRPIMEEIGNANERITSCKIF